MTFKKSLYSTTSQNTGLGLGTSHQMVSDDLLFYLFPNFDTFSHGPKNTRLEIYTFQHGSLQYQKEISVQYGK